MAAPKWRPGFAASLPGLANLLRYQRSWWSGDLQAAVSVAAYLIPQALAYATLAGLAPITGLWAALAPLAVYAVLGTSRLLSVGPESTTALMTAAVLSPLVFGDGARYASYAATLAIMVGGICLCAGMLRLGFLSNLLSRPVLVGYLTGIAILMILGQVGTLFSIPSRPDDSALTRLRALVAGAGDLHWPTALLGVGVIVVVVALRIWAPRWPGPFIGLLVAAVTAKFLGLAGHGVHVVGPVPGGLPNISVPPDFSGTVRELLVPAIGIAVVAFSDNVLTARAFASASTEEIDADAELRALGVSNLAAGLAHGMPVSSSGSRTALAAVSGARTQMYSLIVFVIVWFVLMLGGSLVAFIPSVALGALIIYAATTLIDIQEFRRLARFRRSELVLALTTAIAVIFAGVLYGVFAAVGLTILDLLRRLARAHDSIQGIVPGLPGMHDIDDYPDATVIPGLLVYRYDAPLCFANAEDFRHRALAAVDTASSAVRWFVLNVEANVEVDITAVDALERLRQDLTQRDIVFALARVKQDLRDALTAAGFVDRIGRDRLFLTLPTAVAAFECSQEADDGGAPV
ncbi:SulP family inorganic anion transporter [Mycolicibacterium sp. Y3]